MIKYENDCAGACEPCVRCKLSKPQPHFYCDSCKDEICGTIYLYENQELCESCVLKAIPKIEIDDDIAERLGI